MLKNLNNLSINTAETVVLFVCTYFVRVETVGGFFGLGRGEEAGRSFEGGRDVVVAH